MDKKDRRLSEPSLSPVTKIRTPHTNVISRKYIHPPRKPPANLPPLTLVDDYNDNDSIFDLRVNSLQSK